jgi:hypothetical protein
MFYLFTAMFGAASFAFFQFGALSNYINSDLRIQCETEIYQFASYVDSVRTKVREGNASHLADGRYQLQNIDHRFGLSVSDETGYVAFRTESSGAGGRGFDGSILVYMHSNLSPGAANYRQYLHKVFAGSCMYGWWTGSELQSYCNQVNVMRLGIPLTTLRSIPANSVVFYLQDPKPNSY